MARFLNNSTFRLFAEAFVFHEAPPPRHFLSVALVVIWLRIWELSVCFHWALWKGSLLVSSFTSVSPALEPCPAYSMPLLNISKWVNVCLNKWLGWRLNTFLKIMTRVAKLAPVRVFRDTRRPETHKSMFPTAFIVADSSCCFSFCQSARWQTWYSFADFILY